MFRKRVFIGIYQKLSKKSIFKNECVFITISSGGRERKREGEGECPTAHFVATHEEVSVSRFKFEKKLW